MAPHLSGKLKDAVVTEALDVARNIGDEGDRAKALSGLAPHLSGELKARVVKYWLEMAGSLERENLLETITPIINSSTDCIVREDIGNALKSIIEVSKWWP
jgi:hypothetical protein